MPLCTKSRILADYESLNQAELRRRDGTTLHLYSSLLSLLLRLTSHTEASETEIARRTKEVHLPAMQLCSSRTEHVNRLEKHTHAPSSFADLASIHYVR